MVYYGRQSKRFARGRRSFRRRRTYVPRSTRAFRPSRSGYRRGYTVKNKLRKFRGTGYGTRGVAGLIAKLLR